MSKFESFTCLSAFVSCAFKYSRIRRGGGGGSCTSLQINSIKIFVKLSHEQMVTGAQT